MTVTIDEAQANLARIVGKAAAGEDVVIAAHGGHPAVKLVPVRSEVSRLTRHPDLVGSTKVLDPEALTQPLPPEEWGGLTEH